MPQRARINSQGQVVPDPPLMQYCCLPTGCNRRLEAPIHPDDPGDSVRVICSNSNCTEGRFMHQQCFAVFETQVLGVLRNTGRGRGWSEKQRVQNLWRKQGYDLCYKACGCKCGRGHVRKDLDYAGQPQTDTPRKPRRRGGRGQGGRGLSQLQLHTMPQHERSAPVNVSRRGGSDVTDDHELRVRTSSFSSTGSSGSSSSAMSSSVSSPTSSSASSPSTPSTKTGRFDFFATPEQAAKGNIFRRREDFASFSTLPSSKQNPYDIKMEDEGPYGNDEIRGFLLTELSKQEVVAVPCVVCNANLPVFDRYPLVDGTFFLSTIRYNSDLQLTQDQRVSYLNAVCLGCMEGRRSDIRCLSCKTPWKGSCLQKGTMYSYDIFASAPCCSHRTNCKNCRRPVFDPTTTQAFFSNYSRAMTCPHCRSVDTHLLKPLTQIFYIRNYINPTRTSNPLPTAPCANVFSARANDACARTLAQNQLFRAPPGLQLGLF